MSAGLEDTQPATRDSGPLRVSKISRFEVERTLGEGGNGVVLLARDPTLDRHVAVKILRRRDDPDASARLLREAQAAAKLAHENIIVIHEVGTYEDQVYVAMEHVPGGTLTQWQPRKPHAQILDVYRRAGRGLAAAHAAGLVHRDFKPDNVLVGDDGRVRVTDFGLVSVSGLEAARDEELARSNALGTTLTRTGTIMGTPRYMAPEQHLGEDVDARADQFAFCAALYEALYGRAPFAGDTYGALADSVVAGELRPPPAEVDVPAPVRDAILRGLSRERGGRFTSMAELLALLALPAPRRSRTKLVLATAAVVVLVGAGAFAWHARAKQPIDPVHAAMDEGQAAFKRKDYKVAAAAFRRAILLAPNLDAVGEDYLYDLALSLDKVGDCVGARNAYQRYLSVGRRIDAATRSVVDGRLAALACGSDAVTADEAYRAGEEAYEAGDLEKAIVEFKRGFALEPEISKKGAAYLYNVGQAYRQLGNCAEASFAFKRYLALKSNVAPALRKELEDRIAELDVCAAQQAGSAAGSAVGSATR